ncbi:hypothetical protein BH18GEM1_BH18GEM1_04240 [soil metagenome]
MMPKWTRGRFWRAAGTISVLALLAACGDENPFDTQPPDVTSGDSQVWELALPAFPSGWDFRTAQRLFIGATDIPGVVGTWVLDERADGTLVFVPFSVVAPGQSLVRTGIADLGSVPFESVEEVPGDGYSATSDSSGVAVIEGHVYAFRILIQGLAGSPINYAKLEVITVGQELPDDPRSRFVRFRWAYQVQPLNQRVFEEE